MRDTGKVFKAVSSSLGKVCSFVLPNSVVSMDAPHFAYPFSVNRYVNVPTSWLLRIKLL